MRRKAIIAGIKRCADGVNYKAICQCPFCGEPANSLIAYSETNRWECQACQEKGSVYQHIDKHVLILDTDRDISRGIRA